MLKEHTRLQDEVVGDTAEVYQPIQFISPTDEFEERLRDAILDPVYDRHVSKEVAERLSAELAEAMSNQYNDA